MLQGTFAETTSPVVKSVSADKSKIRIRPAPNNTDQAWDAAPSSFSSDYRECSNCPVKMTRRHFDRDALVEIESRSIAVGQLTACPDPRALPDRGEDRFDVSGPVSS